MLEFIVIVLLVFVIIAQYLSYTKHVSLLASLETSIQTLIKKIKI